MELHFKVVTIRTQIGSKAMQSTQNKGFSTRGVLEALAFGAYQWHKY